MNWSKIVIATLIAIIAGFILASNAPKEQVQPEIKPVSYERSCAIEALYYEARNTSQRERLAVLEVITNRVKHDNYPDTICGVVHEPWQFSYRNTDINSNNLGSNSNLKMDFQDIPAADKKAFLQIEKLVDRKLKSGKIMPNKVLPNDTLFYHTKDIQPYWTKGKRKVIVDSRFRHSYYASNSR